jgi:hypothetical protein
MAVLCTRRLLAVLCTLNGGIQPASRHLLLPPHHPHIYTNTPTQQHANQLHAAAAAARMSAAPTTRTTAFNEYSGLLYRNGKKKREVSDSAERGGTKIGLMKGGKEFTAIEGRTNKHGDLRLRCPRGWVTAKLADGTKLMEIVPAENAENTQSSTATGAEQLPAQRRRPRTMTVALGERKAALQNVFVPEGAATPTKAMLKCAERGQVVPTALQISALIAQLTEAADGSQPGVKKLAKQIQAARPMWSCGCKEVRTTLRAATATATA